MAGWNGKGGMPEFHGNLGEDPDEHPAQFERFCLASSKGGADQFPRRFQGSLAGSVEGWFKELAADIRTDWTRLCEAFLARLRSVRFQLECEEKFLTAKQQPEKCINAYSEKIRKLARLLNYTTIAEMQKVKNVRIKGLRADCYTPEFPAPQRDFEERVSMAEDQERRGRDRTGSGDRE